MPSRTQPVQRIDCRTPTPGKKPTRIDVWKYDLVRDAILKVVPRTGEGVAFIDLPGLVESRLTPTEIRRLGSVSWYTTTVKLEMEVRGELRRVEFSKPQRLKRS